MQIARYYSHLMPWYYTEEQYKQASGNTGSLLKSVYNQVQKDVRQNSPSQHYKNLEDALNGILSEPRLHEYLTQKLGSEVVGKYLGQETSLADANRAAQAAKSEQESLEEFINTFDPDTTTADQVELSKGKMSVALGEAFERTLAYFATEQEMEMSEDVSDDLLRQFAEGIETNMSGANQRTTLKVDMVKEKSYASKGGPQKPTLVTHYDKKTSSLQKTDITISFKGARFNLSAKNYQNLNSIKIVDASPLLNMIDLWNHESAINKYLHSGRFNKDAQFHSTAIKIMGIQALAGGIKKEGSSKLVSALAIRTQDKNRPIRIVPLKDIIHKIGTDELPISTHYTGLSNIGDITKSSLTAEEFTRMLQKYKMTLHMRNLMKSISK